MSETDSDRERELKYALESYEDYRKLTEAMAPETGRIQHNHYFDTKELTLAKARAILRLRVDSGRVILTLKVGQESQEVEGYFDSLELEEEVTVEALDLARDDGATLLALDAEPIRELTKRFGASLSLIPIAEMRNERRVVQDEYQLEIDRVNYSDGGESYEVEIETPDAMGAKDFIETKFQELSISAKPESKTKLERLLERWGKTPE
ncbi:MAG: CYTH domain-containing protein [Planctomycetota bacterium]